MDKNIIHIKSINQLLEGSGLGKATHPLIAVIDTADIVFGKEMQGLKITSEMYSIALKDSSCGLDYGRKSYDFNEGVLFFSAPNQVFTVTKVQELNEVKGWMLYFHPDLIRNSELASKIDDYSFFNYDVNEALHLSEKEQSVLSNIVNLIEAKKEKKSGLPHLTINYLVNAYNEDEVDDCKKFFMSAGANRFFSKSINLNIHRRVDNKREDDLSN